MEIQWDSAAARFESSLENVDWTTLIHCQIQNFIFLENVQSGSRNVISRGKIRGLAEISVVILGLFFRG